VLDELGGAGRDVLFAHGSTKDRLPKIINALKAVRVPVVAIADFDILRDKAKLQQLVISLGGDFAKTERDLNVVTNGLKSETPLRKVALEDALKRRLTELPEVIERSKLRDCEP
jgi:hypothetical protein